MKSMILKTCISSFAAMTLILLSPSWSAASDEESGIAACGHLDEMEAAKQALAAGERDQALQYLRAAREILIACDRQAEIATDPEPKRELGRDLI